MSKTKAIVVMTIICVLIVTGTVFAFVSLDDGELGIYDYIAYPATISLGLDLKGGIYAVYEANSEDTENLESRMQGTATALGNLLFEKGYTERTIALQNNNTRIRVEVPDVDNPETVFNLIGRPATLEFRKEGKDEEKTTDPYVTGKDVEKAYVTLSEDGEYEVALEFNDEGAKKFADATSELVGKPLNIWINDEWKLGPNVNEAITTGRATISGGYTYETASELATSIQAGAFDVELMLIESRTITPTLGVNAIRTSVLAGLIGLALIIIFMISVYRLLGVAASLALMIYTVTYLFILSIFPWVQLTLAGIAGVILSLGMAVDANIIIFSRIKDEYRNAGAFGETSGAKMLEKSVHTSIKDGFRKATSAIIDGNVTTILGCIVMMFIGGASLKSFAITLTIGIVISVFTALVISRVLLYSMLEMTKNKPTYYNLYRGGAENE